MPQRSCRPQPPAPVTTVQPTQPLPTQTTHLLLTSRSLAIGNPDDAGRVTSGTPQHRRAATPRTFGYPIRTLRSGVGSLWDQPCASGVMASAIELEPAASRPSGQERQSNPLTTFPRRRQAPPLSPPAAMPLLPESPALASLQLRVTTPSMQSRARLMMADSILKT